MGLFNNLTTAGLEETTDRLGGGSRIIDTDIYSGRIAVAYHGVSAKGAQFIALHFKHGDQEYKETIYITNQKGENFFLNKDDKTKKVPLPGFVVIDDLCLIATEKPLCEQETEEKVVNIYDFDLKQEVPKSVQVLVGLTDAPISFGIVRILEDQTKKNDQSGEYEPTGKTREVNTIEKVFHTELHLTVPEARAGKDRGEFWDAWLAKNKGQIRDKTSKDGAKSGAPAGAAPGSAAPAAAAQARPSLFGAKK